MGLCGATVITSASAVLISLGGASFQFGMDAWGLAFNNLNFNTSILSRFVKLVAILYSFFVALIIFRILMMLALTEVITRIVLLQILKKLPPSKQRIRLYQENMVGMKIIRQYETFAMGLVLSGLFALILICINTWLTFAEIQQYVLVGLPAVLIMYACAILEVFLKAGASMMEFSQATLYGWGNVLRDASTRIDGMSKGFYDRVLKRLHKIIFPAGGVGIVDRDIKTNHYECLLGYIINIVITRNTV